MSDKTTDAKADAKADGTAVTTPGKQKMTAEDCKRFGLDPAAYGHKSK